MYRRTILKRVLYSVKLDISQKYAGSFLGSSWALIYPVLQLSVYAFLYLIVFRVSPPGLDSLGYVVLIFSGMPMLLSFAEMLSGGVSSLSSNRELLSNTTFPAVLIPVRSVLSNHVSGFFSIIIGCLVAIYAETASAWALLFVPIIWILLIQFSIGVVWVLSLLSLVVRDINHIIGIIIMMLFVLSPFAYTPDMMPEFLKVIVYINPLSYFVMSMQNVLCYGTAPDVKIFVVMFIMSELAFFCGLFIFEKVKNVYLDYV